MSEITVDGLFRPLTLVLTGASQTGKSTFVNKLFGIQLASVGEGKTSCTRDVTLYPPTRVPGANLLFVVDTPGISDTHIANEKIARTVVSGAKEKCDNKRRKFVILFVKFIEAFTDPTKAACNLAKSLQLELEKFSKPVGIMVVCTYSNVPSHTIFPGGWLKKVWHEKIPDCGSEKYPEFMKFLFEENKKVIVETLNREPFGLNISLDNLICCDLLVEDEKDVFNKLPIKWSDVVDSLSKKDLAFVAHMAQFSSINEVREYAKVLPTGIGLGGGAVAGGLALLVGASVAPVALAVMGVGSLALAITAYARSTVVKRTEIYMTISNNFLDRYLNLSPRLSVPEKKGWAFFQRIEDKHKFILEIVENEKFRLSDGSNYLCRNSNKLFWKKTREDGDVYEFKRVKERLTLRGEHKGNYYFIGTDRNLEVITPIVVENEDMIEEVEIIFYE